MKIQISMQELWLMTKNWKSKLQSLPPQCAYLELQSGLAHVFCPLLDGISTCATTEHCVSRETASSNTSKHTSLSNTHVWTMSFPFALLSASRSSVHWHACNSSMIEHRSNYRTRHLRGESLLCRLYTATASPCLDDGTVYLHIFILHTFCRWLDVQHTTSLLALTLFSLMNSRASCE